jgi:chaperonin cofactor prefoldin
LKNNLLILQTDKDKLEKELKKSKKGLESSLISVEKKEKQMNKL